MIWYSTIAFECDYVYNLLFKDLHTATYTVLTDQASIKTEGSALPPEQNEA